MLSLEDLFGPNFIAFTGAKNIEAATEKIGFSLPKNFAPVDHIVITFVGGQYRMEFFRGTKLKSTTTVLRYQLQRAFTETTGIYLGH